MENKPFVVPGPSQQLERTELPLLTPIALVLGAHLNSFTTVDSERHSNYTAYPESNEKLLNSKHFPN